MKLTYAVCCTLFVAVLIEHSTAASINQPGKSACGSGATADYKGACDESVPVIVMPKGRPIMERVLDWFKCDNEECKSSESSEETTTATPILSTTTRRVTQTPSTKYTTTRAPTTTTSTKYTTTRAPTSTITTEYTTTTRPPMVGTGTAA